MYTVNRISNICSSSVILFNSYITCQFSTSKPYYLKLLGIKTCHKRIRNTHNTLVIYGNV